MADLHDPSIAISGTVQTPGATMDGHHHHQAPKLSGSDAQLCRSGPPDMTYGQAQLVKLIALMKDVMIGNHNELPAIARSSKYLYPDFAKALEEFSKEASLQIEDSLRDAERLELIERLYRAEQMKTAALAEYSKF